MTSDDTPCGWMVRDSTSRALADGPDRESTEATAQRSGRCGTGCPALHAGKHGQAGPSLRGGTLVNGHERAAHAHSEPPGGNTPRGMRGSAPVRRREVGP